MVDDEAAGGAEAGAVAVAGQDEQVGAVGRGDDLAFDAARAFGAGAGLAQAVGGGLQELVGGGGGQLLHAGAGIAFLRDDARWPAGSGRLFSLPM